MRRRVYVEAFEEYSTYSSMIFLVHLVQAFPMPIECVQTDNGTEFTKRFTKASLNEDLTLFERKLKELGIKHKKIRPFTPRHNGKVERSHRKDNKRFYATHCFFSFEDFRLLPSDFSSSPPLTGISSKAHHPSYFLSSFRRRRQSCRRGIFSFG